MQVSPFGVAANRTALNIVCDAATAAALALARRRLCVDRHVGSACIGMSEGINQTFLLASNFLIRLACLAADVTAFFAAFWFAAGVGFSCSFEGQ